MKIKLTISVAIFVACSVLIACKKETEKPIDIENPIDAETPTITVKSPIQCSEHLSGTQVHLEATFEDDLNLSSYEVYASDDQYVEDTSFHFHLTENISGKKYEFHEHFVVPANPYSWRYFFFTLTDASGKSTTELFILHFAQ